MSKQSVVTLLGLSWIGFLIYLSFVNWKAAVFICLIQIALNTGGTKLELGKKRMIW